MENGKSKFKIKKKQRITRIAQILKREIATDEHRFKIFILLFKNKKYWGSG
jgi:hypothetical protein